MRQAPGRRTADNKASVPRSRTIRRQPRVLSAAAAFHNQARYPSRTTACCFSMSSRSSDRMCWRYSRQPLESGKVEISRVNGSETFPCSFMFVTAMNPCKCGNYGNPVKPCTCKPADVKKYHSKISGPLLERIDMQIEVNALSFNDLSDTDRPLRVIRGNPRQSQQSEKIRDRAFLVRRGKGQVINPDTLQRGNERSAYKPFLPS